MAATASPQLSTREERIDSVALLSWGANSYGQLSQGHREDRLTPRETVATECIPQVITGGGGHTLVITSVGTLWVCGSNSHGQLGLGSRDDVEVLTQVAFPLPLQIMQVSGGWDFTLACTAGGDLYTWGSNAFCQLGRDTAQKHSTLPGKVDLPTGSPVVCVSAGLRHGLALTEDGSVFGWGQNKKGQLGHIVDGDGMVSKTVTHPVQLNISTKGKVLQVTSGAYHSGALTDTHEVYLWGCNKFGQLSLDPGSTPRLSQPHCLSTSAFGGQKLRCIVSGWTHNLALTGSGQVYSWGRADYGQLGRSCDGSCDPTPKPVAGVHDVASIVCGSEHNLTLTEEGKLMCWGWNEHGICGTGDESNVPLPTQVALPAKHIISIGCGAGHSFALVNR